MPKKKLTKAQVKRKVQTATNALYDLTLDKLAYGTRAEIPTSFDKLKAMHQTLLNALNRMRK
tara:strand:- start:40 stop:225 length:186 start_codon:yes stop_codon:yes gene_type:complete